MANGPVIPATAHSESGTNVAEPAKWSHRLASENPAQEMRSVLLEPSLPVNTVYRLSVASCPMTPAPEERDPVEATSPVLIRPDGPKDSGTGQETAAYPSGFRVTHAALPEETTPPVQFSAASVPLPEVTLSTSQLASVTACRLPTPTGPPRSLGGYRVKPPVILAIVETSHRGSTSGTDTDTHGRPPGLCPRNSGAHDWSAT